MNDRVMIIGAGIAGMRAAIELASQGMRCVIAAATQPQRTQSVMAEGGINAALDTMGEGDSPVIHAQETLHAGCDLASSAAVANMTAAAPALLYDLQRHGMNFTLTSFAEKKIRLRSFGGQKKKRTAYADTLTGRQLVHTLAAQMRRFGADGTIECLFDLMFLRLSRDACGKVNGAYFYERMTKSVRFIAGRAVIVCCGGLNGMFGNATGSVVNTGAAAASLFASGVEMANLEMIQYHPTTAKLFAKNMLISEAARGEGGRLFAVKDAEHVEPYYFMEEKYPEGGNLMTRDVISKEEHLLMKEGWHIYLDLRGLDEKVYKNRLKGIVTACEEFLHIDVRKAPIPITPGIHYFMGGIYVDASHRTNIAGLYAAGECACQYHGANRLGGNSTLGALYGGMTAARSALEDMASLSEDGQACPMPSIACDMAVMHYGSEKAQLQSIMREALGVERNEQTLNEAIASVEELLEKTKDCADPDAYFDENDTWQAQCMLAIAMLKSAAFRKESRGAHFRSDYPNRNEEYRKTTVSYLRDGRIVTEAREIEP